MNEIIFDQYSRYKICADLLEKITDFDNSILDVGSGEDCILERLLPNHKITFVDPLLSNQNKNQLTKISGNVFSKELDSKKFDFIICVDTFEHIPSEKRMEFLERLDSLSTKGLILATPCNDTGDALDTDKSINSHFRNIFASDYKWLEEHNRYGLPSAEKIHHKFSELQFHTQKFQQGHSTWLKKLLPLVIYILEHENDKSLVYDLSEFFNDNLYQYDHREPCYRQVFLATRKEIPEIQVQPLLDSTSIAESDRLWEMLEKQVETSIIRLLNDKNNLQSEKDSQVTDLTKQLSEKDSQVTDLTKQLSEKDSQVTDLTKQLSEKDSQVTDLTKQLSQQILHIESLKNDTKNLEKAIEEYQNLITEIHQSFVLRMLHKYDKTIGKIIPLRPKQFLKSSKQFQTEKQISETISDVSESKKKDILCFPIINWDFRYQRPQHFLSQFADRGHRVFYFTVNLRKLKTAYEIKKIQDNVFQVELNSPAYFDIYKDKFNHNTINEILKSFDKLKNDLGIDAVMHVQFPTWAELALEIKNRYGFKMVFDCLDDFAGFDNVINHRISEEEMLFSRSDLVLASSSHLLQKAMKHSENCLFLPNACEFEHFNKNPNSTILSKYKKPIIGYFGSIADWFDTELLEHLAKNCPEYTFVMIGHTFGSDIRNLKKLKNVYFLGERPYSELPKYLHSFDVCLIPFRKTPLIHATHPIKIYEYMAAGKPVVATDMPELYPMSKLCYISKSKEDFLENLKRAVNEDSQSLQKERIEFASKNTWKDRFEKLYAKMEPFEMNHHN